MEIASDVKPNPELPIVGIGASAGGLESFVQLLSGLSGDNGFAIIFVQHLDPNHPSLASEIIGRATKMAVREIRDGDVAEVNHVYALPPNFDLTISKGILKLHPRRSSTSSHRPIDAFFQSLALDKGVRAMGVVLSGTATDGTEGLLSIKAECRITFAQTPESAKFDGMPKAAIDAGVVDLTCDPKAIAEELLQITKDTSIAPPKNSDKGKDEDPLEEIVALLWKYNSVDFTDYKKTTLKRRIARRMIILKQASEKSYATFLADNPEEVKILFAEILIHVTSFFRDADEFAALSAQAFPAIVKSHADGSPIRIWVAGCSTGEEAYSIAISILEFLGDRAGSQAIEIFASDISDSAIQVARQGIYSEISAKNIPEALLARYFTKCAEGYKVNKAVRELCLFSKHDVTADPPFARVDLISCRNLLIYFTPALQKRAFPIFHYALRPDGFLFLGHSESVGAFANLFQAAQGNHKIFLKKAGPAVLPRMHFSPGRNTSELTYGVSKSVPQFKSGFDSQREADRIVALKYGPSGVVVNEDLEILGFRGRTVPYLEQPSGSASRQLLKMANPDLAAELRSLLNAVKKQPLPVRKENLILGSVAQSERLNIEVIPLNSALPTSERQYLVLFEKVLPLDGGAVPTAPKTATPDDSIFEQRILQLELQLSSSKEYQQTLAEDHESAQEEVSAANEELQSTNEELTTVNDELQNSNGELAHLSNDLINLLSSIEIPMIIVGADHKIRRFTTTATKVLSLVQTDIGRSILDIRSNLKLSNLDTLISEVMDTLKIKEIEVQDHQGHWYRLQIRPYETSDHKIDGAVLSFVDIEVLKQALGRMKLALGHATSISEALQMPSMIVDRELKVRSVNQLFCKIFNLTAAATEGKDLAAIANKNWNGTELTKLLQDTVLVKKAFRDFELSGDFAGIGKRTYLLSAREFRWIDVPETEPESILITIFDITERKNIELALEESELTYRTILESAHDSIVAVDDKGIIKIANSQTEKWFGYPRGELLGKNFEILIPNAFRQSHAKLHKDYLAQPTARAMAERSSLSGQRKDGTTFPIEV
jgi:two-component system CheB/CheR fusion protein